MLYSSLLSKLVSTLSQWLLNNNSIEHEELLAHMTNKEIDGRSKKWNLPKVIEFMKKYICPYLPFKTTTRKSPSECCMLSKLPQKSWRTGPGMTKYGDISPFCVYVFNRMEKVALFFLIMSPWPTSTSCSIVHQMETGWQASLRENQSSLETWIHL